MRKKSAISVVEGIEKRIYVFRGLRVMLDSDLAEVYRVPTKQLNQQLRRNQKRFPEDFAFQLDAKEFATLRSQIVTSNERGGRRHRPWAFTEHGAIMLATILNSPTAIAASVRVVRAFVFMREQLASNKELSSKLAELEHRLDGHDTSIQQLFGAIRKLLEPPPPEPERREIGFHVKGRTSLTLGRTSPAQRL